MISDAPALALHKAAAGLQRRLRHRLRSHHVQVSARHWSGTGHIDALISIDCDDVGHVVFYEVAGPAVTATALRHSVQQIERAILRRLDCRLVVGTESPTTVTVQLQDTEGVALPAQRITATQVADGSVTVAWVRFDGTQQTELWHHPSGFPGRQRLIETFTRAPGPRPSVRALLPTGEAIHLRGSDVDAFFAPEAAVALARQYLNRACAQHGFTLEHLAMRGPGCLDIAVRTDVGLLRNHVAVSPLLGAERGMACAAAWIEGLWNGAVMPHAQRQGVQLIIRTRDGLRSIIAGISAHDLGGLLELRGEGDDMPRDVGLLSKTGDLQHAYDHALFDAYRGPWELRVQTNDGPRRLPSVPTLAPEDRPDFRPTPNTWRPDPSWPPGSFEPPDDASLS